MATDLLYLVGRVGTGKYSKRDDRASAIQLFNDKINSLGDTVQLRVNNGEWGRDRNHATAKDRAQELVRDFDAGNSLAVRDEKEKTGNFILKVTVDSKGHIVVKSAISQIGAPYIWAEIDPKGPEGGPGAGFDCSGLCVWCYEQADVILPHNSEAIRQTVTLFKDKSKVVPGDLVFFHTDDRNGPNAASHIAICESKDKMIVAPHTGSYVQRQDISDLSWAFMSYGFVRSVTGNH